MTVIIACPGIRAQFDSSCIHFDTLMRWSIALAEKENRRVLDLQRARLLSVLAQRKIKP